MCEGVRVCVVVCMCTRVHVVHHPSHVFPLSSFWSLAKMEGERPGQLSLRKTSDKEGKGLNKLEVMSVQVAGRDGEGAEQGSHNLAFMAQDKQEECGWRPIFCLP